MKAKHGAKERHASRGLMWQAWSKIKACIQRKEKVAGTEQMGRHASGEWHIEGRQVKRNLFRKC
jgi:hypothetical protein